MVRLASELHQPGRDKDEGGQIRAVDRRRGLALMSWPRLSNHQYLFALSCRLVALAVPLAYVASHAPRRLAKFEEHFPEALDLIGRAVRAGHAFTTGLEMVSKESSEPVAGEFRATFEEQNFGLPLRDALLNMAERVPLIDVRFFVTALLVQKETGGNLAEILDELSRLIRERFRIYREVKVRTAQGRLTAADSDRAAVLDADRDGIPESRLHQGCSDDPIGRSCWPGRSDCR